MVTRSALRAWAAVSVPVSFTAIQASPGAVPHAGGQPPMNPGEHPRTAPTTPPTQLEACTPVADVGLSRG